jgi:hypothetical protein
LEGLGMETIVIYYDHLKYFSVTWYNLWPFGIVCSHISLFPFWYVWTMKNLATLLPVKNTAFENKHLAVHKQRPN